ncbi:MAG: hypothetical protein KUL76_07060, partial [Kaistella sp.]|nr:hypothetical protein [Kaistella sp.]
MKNFTRILTLFLLISLFSPLFGQKYYDDQWKKVSDNYKTGKYKSNLPIILEIQKQAMKDDNANQLIRSLKAEFSIVNQTRDDENNDSVSQFFTKLSTFGDQLKGEQRLLYDVLLTAFFAEYYQNESWEIGQRTNINNQDFSQIETWSKLDFKNFLSKQFAALDAKKEDLQKIQLSRYKEIFEETQDLDYFPTLFDWNAVNQIQFLRENDFFTPNELKANHPKILSIYDELISKNSGNSKLYFGHQILNYNCEFSNCKDKLTQLENLYKSATEGDYKVQVAAEIIDELTQDQKYKEALIWVNSAKKTYPKSKFLNNILQRENQIVNPSLAIKFENHTQANLPIHLVAEAKNLQQFSLNIYEVKSDFQNFLKYVSDSYSKENFAAVKKTLVRKENFELQDLKDYKTHKTSLEIKPLPSGIYMVEYVVEGAIHEHFYFIATQSRLIYNKKDERKTLESEIKLVDRENGKSIPNEDLKITEFVRGKTATIFAAKTDASSNFKFPGTAEKDYYRYYLVQQPKTNDFNLIQKYGSRYYGENKIQNREQAQIFLDRAIYRPGQTVYFKVINTKLLNEKESVSPGISQKITLHDANGEEISSQNFKTNDFGSYHGSFILPNGKLNGSFSLQVKGNNVDSYKSFQVEEYKRPKFEVTIEPVKDEYKYGQTIEIKGKAMMFSGVALSNATVN